MEPIRAQSPHVGIMILLTFISRPHPFMLQFFRRCKTPQKNNIHLIFPGLDCHHWTLVPNVTPWYGWSPMHRLHYPEHVLVLLLLTWLKILCQHVNSLLGDYYFFQMIRKHLADIYIRKGHLFASVAQNNRRINS